MSTSILLLPAGKVSDPIPVTPLMSLMAAPQVLGGTVLIEQAPTQAGPWQTVAAAQGYAQSARALTNSWMRVTSATQAAVVAVSDIGAGSGGGTNFDSIVNCQAVLASPNTTSEVVLATFRIPPGLLKPNFRLRIRGVASFTNNANAKTMQVRMNGLAGTLIYQSTALASLANASFEAMMAGIGDGATLKGFGSGLTSVGLGTSTTALTTLARDYINNETEVVVTATKATGTDTFQLDSLLVNLDQ
jgi:hypothetical protein